MRFFGKKRAFGPLVAVAALCAGFVAAAPAAKADMAGLSLGLADAACRARAASESYGVWQQFPEYGTDMFYSAYWTCRYGG